VVPVEVKPPEKSEETKPVDVPVETKPQEKSLLKETSSAETK
jgi:hypothetical protein